MRTVIVKSPGEAAKFIKRSELVGFPTETVYGLGANVFDDDAVRKIFKVKGRPEDNPLIVHVSSKKQVEILAEEVPPSARKIIREYFPGPVTVILKKNEIISGLVTAGLGTIAVRMPSSRIAREFIKACGVPIAAPSANLSGSPSPTTFLHVLEDLRGKIPCVLVGPGSRYGLESTVVDCTGEVPVVLRPGVITIEQLRKIDRRIVRKLYRKRIKSPGQRHKHYSPKAKVVLLDNKRRLLSGKYSGKLAYIGIKGSRNKNELRDVIHLSCMNADEYAKHLFSFFRECDTKGVKVIFAEKISEKGIGMAIMNRLRKAARR